MNRKLAHVASRLVLMALVVVAADRLGARSAFRIGARILMRLDGWTAACQAEQRHLAAERRDRLVRQHLQDTRDLQESLQGAQTALSEKLHRQRTTAALAQEQAEQIRERYQAAAARDEWPVEYRGRPYRRLELEAQVKQLLLQAAVAKNLCWELEQFRGRIAGEEAQLAVERDYCEIQSHTTAVLANSKAEE